jgi:hypothetical protein
VIARCRELTDGRGVEFGDALRLLDLNESDKAHVGVFAAKLVGADALGS